MTIALKCPAQLPATLQAEVSPVTVTHTKPTKVSVLWTKVLLLPEQPSILLTYHSIIFTSGSARLYREPVSKTNRPIILNAVEYVVLPGEVRIIKIIEVK